MKHAPGPARTVLLVEDDANDVFLTERAFKKAGEQVQFGSVSDGDEAIRYLSGEGKYQDRAQFPLPTLVLLDLKLPGRSGFEILQWIRSHEALVRLRVAILSSSQEQTDIEKAYDLGTSSYFVKPVEAGQMMTLVQTIIQYWFILNRLPDRLQPAS